MIKIWIIDVLVIFVSIATFTSLVIPPNTSTPTLWGIPFTMWMGFVISVLLVLFTYMARIIQQKDDHDH